MWIFTTGGFVSAVQHRDDPDKVMVRARDKESLETMLEGIELAGTANGEVFERPEIVSVPGDYRWRVTVSKATFAVFVQFEILNYLNYENYKDALTKVRGDVWHRATMGVWTSMLQVDDGPAEEVDERNWAFGVHGFNGGHGSVHDMTEEEWAAFMEEAPGA